MNRAESIVDRATELAEILVVAGWSEEYAIDGAVKLMDAGATPATLREALAVSTRKPS